MKKLFVLFLALICVLSLPACLDDQTIGEENVTYIADLSIYPTDKACMGYGEIKEITDGKLLVAPGSDADKATFGELVWLSCDQAFAYSVGQVVTYTFRDVKAPDKKGEPLTIMAELVYME